MMKVRFDATLEDFVDVGILSSGPRRQLYLVGIVAGLIVGGLLGNVTLEITKNGWLFLAMFSAGLVGTFLGLVGLPKKNLEVFYAKRIGITSPVPYEVEISENGLRCSAQGQTTTSDWKIVEDLIETDNAIYFRNKFGIYVAVRKRGFIDDEEMKEFLALARRYWSDATVPQPPSFEEANS